MKDSIPASRKFWYMYLVTAITGARDDVMTEQVQTIEHPTTETVTHKHRRCIQSAAWFPGSFAGLTGNVLCWSYFQDNAGKQNNHYFETLKYVVSSSYD